MDIDKKLEEAVDKLVDTYEKREELIIEMNEHINKLQKQVEELEKLSLGEILYDYN